MLAGAPAQATNRLTMPWMFYTGPDATLAEKVEGMKRFRKDLASDQRLARAASSA